MVQIPDKRAKFLASGKSDVFYAFLTPKGVTLTVFHSCVGSAGFAPASFASLVNHVPPLGGFFVGEEPPKGGTQNLIDRCNTYLTACRIFIQQHFDVENILDILRRQNFPGRTLRGDSSVFQHDYLIGKFRSQI